MANQEREPNPNKEALKKFEFKVSDVFKLYPEGLSASDLI